ncbi:MAG: putative short-chain type dehydrogenase/reductase [Acidimicrobiales bacterium]|nr:putative short-chain type dehydrogenase/reductase [Acidimicrobiales bacterium]
MGLLEGKVAIVTGAGRGIGRCEALKLAGEGATVVVNDFDGPDDTGSTPAEQVVGQIEATGGKAVANRDDVADFKGAESLVDQAIQRYGQLDILVNNAGFIRDAMSFSMSEADFDAVVNVHLKGHFAPSHYAGAHWRERSKAGEQVSGRIINTVSEAGLYGLAGQMNYVAAKAGIAAMTISLGRELGKYGVTANAIAPRARTRMTETVLTGLEPQEGQFDEWDPGNIAPVVAWLASDAAAEVNGQVFVVFANRVHLMNGWGLESTIETEGQWTVEDLVSRSEDLFADRDRGLPQPGFGR